MNYYQPAPGIHFLMQPAKRNRTYLEFTYTSGGSWFETEGDRGKRHLLEHCLVSRTHDKNFEEVKDYCFQENLDLNAYTSSLPMSLVSAGHKDDFDKLLNLLLEFFLEPTFDQRDLDREKEIVLREISERKGDPNYILYYETLNQVFTPDSLDTHQVLGNIQDVAGTSLEDLKRMHKQVLQESNLILKFSGGGFEEQEVQDKIMRAVNRLNNVKKEAALGSPQRYPVGYLPKNEFSDFANLAYAHPLGHEHAEVTVYIPCQTNFDNRPAQAIFEQLYLKYGGILYDRLRDELGLVYGISGSFRQTMQALEIELACEIRHVKKILSEIINTFSDFDRNFKREKFLHMKSKVKKQKDMAADNPKFFVDFTEKRMLNYGIAESYETYGDRIEQVSEQNIRDLYQEIQDNLPNKKVVVVSKSSRIETDDIFI
jgi:predicted Zn-dependent peptidase